jgi:hypothetical protein
MRELYGLAYCGMLSFLFCGTVIHNGGPEWLAMLGVAPIFPILITIGWLGG